MPYRLSSVMGPTTEHMTAIGMVAAECASLENIVQTLLIDMAGLPYRKGLCITAHMPIRTVCDSVESLAGELGFSDSTRKELKRLMTDTIRLVGERNSIVHALWGISPQSTIGKGEATAIVVKSRAQLTIKHENMTPQAIAKISVALRLHTKKVADFRALHTKPEKRKT